MNFEVRMAFAAANWKKLQILSFSVILLFTSSDFLRY